MWQPAIYKERNDLINNSESPPRSVGILKASSGYHWVEKHVLKNMLASLKAEDEERGNGKEDGKDHGRAGVDVHGTRRLHRRGGGGRGGSSRGGLGGSGSSRGGGSSSGGLNRGDDGAGTTRAA